jgi:glutathione S-transferase
MTKLIHFRLCPLSRSIRFALAELKADATLEEERPWEWREAFLALNPSGEIPVLCPDGRAPVCGVYAISEYLAETHSATSPSPQMRLFPGSPEQRAECRRLVDWFHGKFHREVTKPLLEEKLYSRFDPSGARKPDAETLRGARANLRYHLGYLEFLSHDKNWLAGSEMSFGDLAAAAHISSLDYLGEAVWEERPMARQWYARMKSRPSMRAILAERVPGAPPPPAHYADPDF